jgi:ankyrin repeat protein
MSDPQEIKLNAENEGILFWLGTNGGTEDWQNPAEKGLVRCACSSKMGNSKPMDALCGRETVRCVTQNKPDQWVSIDLVNKYVVPTAYMLRHYISFDTEALRNWRLEATNDDTNWYILSTHVEDDKLKTKGGTYTWELSQLAGLQTPFRRFRISQTGQNSNRHHYLACSGIELFGKVYSEAPDNLEPSEEELRTVTGLAKLTEPGPDLLSASEQGNLEKVKLVVTTMQPDLNFAEAKTNATALIKASANGHLAIVKYLVQSGAEVNGTDVDGMTALMHAVVKSHLKVVNYLVDAGSNQTLQDSISGYTAIMFAIHHKHTVLVSRLLRQAGNSLDLLNSSGKSALLMATESNTVPAIKQLLMSGASQSVVDSKTGDSALMIAIRNKFEDATKVLLRLNPFTGGKDIEGKTALILATERDDSKLVDMLLKNGASPGAKSQSGKSALDYAQSNVVKSLLADALRPRRFVPKEGDFDKHGIIYNIGTGFGAHTWSNPAKAGIVVADSSSLMNNSEPITAICGRSLVRCVTVSEPRQWISVDLVDKWLVPTHYSIKHYSSWDTEALRNWRFDVSNDGKEWYTLKVHENDAVLTGKGATHTWALPNSGKATTPFRMFRIYQTGKNSNDHEYLACSGLELYGTLHFAEPDLLGPSEEEISSGVVQTPPQLRRQPNAEEAKALLEAVSDGNLADLTRMLVDDGMDCNVSNDAGESALLLANRLSPSSEETMKIVKLMVEHGAHVNATSKKGSCPLIAACMRNNVESARYLIENGARIEQRTLVGDSSLSLAVWKDATEVAIMLIEMGSDIHRVDQFGDTVLVDAANNNNMLLIQTLLERGIDVNHQNKKGHTPLIKSVSADNAQAVKMLLDFGAKPNLQEERGLTALAYALLKGHNECFDLLLQYGADPNIQDEDGDNLLSLPIGKNNLKLFKELLMVPGIRLDDRNKKTGATLLMTACKAGHLHFVRYLVEQLDVDTDAVDDAGKNCVEYAATNSQKEVLEYFMRREARMSSDIFDDSKLKAGEVAMFAAAHTGDEESVELMKWLTNHGEVPVDVDAIHPRTGETVLMVSAVKNDTRMINALYGEARAKVEIIDWAGKTALIKACEAGSFDTAKYLVDLARADPEAQDEEGKTALIYTVLGQKPEHREIAKHLLTVTKVNREQGDNCGWTAFAHAVHANRRKMAQFLIEQSCDINTQDIDGVTPLIRAANNQEWNLFSYLLNDVQCNPHTPDYSLRSPLMVVCWHGRSDVAKNVLSKYSKEQLMAGAFYRLSVVNNDENSQEEPELVVKQVEAAGANVPKGFDAKTHVRGTSKVRAFYDQKHTGPPVTPAKRMNLVSRAKQLMPMSPTRSGGHRKAAVLLEQDVLNGWTAILVAAHGQEQKKVEYFVENFRGIIESHSNTKLRCPSALVFAIQQGNVDITQYLVEQGSGVEPVMLCLKYAEGFRELKAAQPSRASDFSETAKQFTDMARALFDKIPSDHLAAWLLENRFNGEKQSVLEYALETNNIEFVCNARVTRITDFWWSRTWIEFERDGPGDQGEDEDDADMTMAVAVGRGDDPPGSPSHGSANSRSSRHHKKHIQKLDRDYPVPGRSDTGDVLMIWMLWNYPFRFYRIPQVKFATEVLSYMTFLTLFTVMLNNEYPVDSTTFHLIEAVVLFWEVAFVASEFAQIQDLKNYLRDGWNLLDITVAICLFVVYICRALYLFKWITDPCNDCVASDIYTIAMATNMIAMTLRTCFVFTMHEVVGPLLIMVRRMGGDVVNFIVLESVLIFAFIFSFRFVISGDNSEGFSNLNAIMLTLIDTSLGNAPNTNEPFTDIPKTRQIVAQVMLVLFIIASAVVLVNLLIAMMSSTYEGVKENSFNMYAFTRVEAILRYDRSNDMPAPLNLFVLLFHFFVRIVYVPCRLCRSTHAALNPVQDLSSDDEQQLAGDLSSDFALSDDDEDDNYDSDHDSANGKPSAIPLVPLNTTEDASSEFRPTQRRSTFTAQNEYDLSALPTLKHPVSDDVKKQLVDRPDLLRKHVKARYCKHCCSEMTVHHSKMAKRRRRLSHSTDFFMNMITADASHGFTWGKGADDVLVQNLDAHISNSYLRRCRQIRVCPVCYRGSPTFISTGRSAKEYVSIAVFLLIAPVILVLVPTVRYVRSLFGDGGGRRLGRNSTERNRRVQLMTQLEAIHDQRKKRSDDNVEQTVREAVQRAFAEHAAKIGTNKPDAAKAQEAEPEETPAAEDADTGNDANAGDDNDSD